MIGWAILDASGRVPLELGRSRVLPVGAVQLPADLMPVAAATMMLDAGRWVPRPELPEPTAEPTKEGLALAWTALPQGAELTVRDADTGEVLAVIAAAAGEIRCTLADPGPYLIDLAGPLPWRAFERRITA